MNHNSHNDSTQKLTIKSFWDRNPKIYVLQASLFLLIEVIFLAFSIRAVAFDLLNSICNSQDKRKILRSAILLLAVIHFYDILRLVYLIRQKIKKVVNPKPSIRRCCFINCYSFVAIFSWIYAQSCYFVAHETCDSDIARRWLFVEVIYQWVQVGFNLCQVFIIFGLLVHRQRKILKLDKIKRAAVQAAAQTNIANHLKGQFI